MSVVRARGRCPECGSNAVVTDAIMCCGLCGHVARIAPVGDADAMDAISNPNQLHFTHPVTMAQLAEVRDAIKAGHPEGTKVELVLSDPTTVNVEIAVPGADLWRARFGVPAYEAAP